MSVVPPMILDLRVARPDRSPVHVWLPIFLLWPVFLVIGVLALVCTIFADIVLLLVGQPYHRYSVLLVRSFGLLCETRGTVLHFTDHESAVDMTVQ
jgi:hypothetical protein